MGLYDGASGRGELASTAHVAKLLQAPVVLVVDCRGDGALGRRDRPRLPHVRPRRERRGRDPEQVGSAFHADILREALPDIPVLGALPRNAVARGARAPPRARPGRRAQAARARRDRAPRRGDEGALRPRGARRAARSPRPSCPATRGRPRREPAKVRVAIARGPAFSFHYEENLELLQGAGAELAEFDPLHDEALPEDTDALILAGGFPEIFGEELSANAALRSADRGLRRPDPRRVRRPAVPRRDAGRAPDVRRARRSRRT